MPRLLPLLFALSVGLGGCSVLSSDSSVGNPKNALTVTVNDPPPPAKTEGARPPAPGFGYIWVDGYWDYLAGTYIWRDGRWVQGKRDYEYVRARYEFDNASRTWVFHRPHWKLRHPQATAAKG